MPRLVYLSGLALLLLAGAFLATDALLWEPGLTERNTRRVRPGMTLEEVEALFGSPGRLVGLHHRATSGREGEAWIWSVPNGGASWVHISEGRVIWAAWWDRKRERFVP